MADTLLCSERKRHLLLTHSKWCWISELTVTQCYKCLVTKSRNRTPTNQSTSKGTNFSFPKRNERGKPNSRLTPTAEKSGEKSFRSSSLLRRKILPKKNDLPGSALCSIWRERSRHVNLTSKSHGSTLSKDGPPRKRVSSKENRKRGGSLNESKWRTEDCLEGKGKNERRVRQDQEQCSTMDTKNRLANKRGKSKPLSPTYSEKGGLPGQKKKSRVL